jgi:septal ring factor EnvC (AmiA/AmiB activator)
MKMSTAVRFVVSVLATAIIAAVATHRVSAVPETSQSPADPIAALLVEVRALRIAMQQNATLAPRVQLTLARLNIEEQRIGQLASQLDQVRRELNNSLLETQKLSDQLPDLERGLQTTTDDKARTSYEYERNSLKQKLAAQARLEEQLRAREAESVQSLSTEQGRWTDLNARLDSLEQLLGPIPRQ